MSDDTRPVDDRIDEDGEAGRHPAAPTRSGGIELPMAPPPGSAPRRSATGMGRREALKIMGLAAAAGATGMGTTACEPGDPQPDRGGAADDIDTRESAHFEGATTGGNPNARGWPWDPDLVKPTRPWDLVLTDDEREGLIPIVDAIIPADDLSPAASAVGVIDYIDEWVSAPMESMERDLVLVRGGLAWMDRQAATRFGEGRRFRDLTVAERTAILDDVRWRETTADEHLYGSRFFDKVRDLTCTAFYTTQEGMNDIGYVGNVPVHSWEPPPPEVIAHLGLEDELARWRAESAEDPVARYDAELRAQTEAGA